MNSNSRRVLHLVAGMYLIYLGINLIMQQINEATSNAPVAIGAAVLFLGFGGYLIYKFIKQGVKDFHEQENEDNQEQVEVIEENKED